eukprot:7876349-Alexandrium_andersonii.AAC.1
MQTHTNTHRLSLSHVGVALTVSSAGMRRWPVVTESPRSLAVVGTCEVSTEPNLYIKTTRPRR